jgi:hypothetical protein
VFRKGVSAKCEDILLKEEKQKQKQQLFSSFCLAKQKPPLQTGTSNKGRRQNFVWLTKVSLYEDFSDAEERATSVVAYTSATLLPHQLELERDFALVDDLYRRYFPDD